MTLEVSCDIIGLLITPSERFFTALQRPCFRHDASSTRSPEAAVKKPPLGLIPFLDHLENGEYLFATLPFNVVSSYQINVTSSLHINVASSHRLVTSEAYTYSMTFERRKWINTTPHIVESATFDQDQIGQAFGWFRQELEAKTGEEIKDPYDYPKSPQERFSWIKSKHVTEMIAAAKARMTGNDASRLGKIASYLVSVQNLLPTIIYPPSKIF